ncbi:MAG: hypothetical protein U0R71_16325 [Solirubrobacterales bacterium]
MTSGTRKWSLAGLLALVASAIFLVPVTQAGAATFNTACVNNIIAAQSALIPVTMTASVPPSVETGSSFTLSEIKQELAVPPTVFLSGYSLELLSAGKNEIPTSINTVIAGTNTTVESQKTNSAETVAVTTITDPDGIPGNKSPGEGATPGVVKVTYANQSWTAAGTGAVGFRVATVIDPKAANPPGFGFETGAINIFSKVGPGGVIKAKFGCDPGNVVEEALPETIERVDPAVNFASTNAVAPKAKYALTLTKSGSGAGSFQCDTGSGPGACAAEYTEGTTVKVIGKPNAGSQLVAFSGDCSGTSCELTMNGAKTVNAQFDLELVALSVSTSGSGTVACEVNASPASCNGSYSYGSTIKVVATPAAENNLGSLTGSGSASGKCSAESKQCNFALTAASTVTAVFETAGSKATSEGVVYGEVPQTTSITSLTCGSVNLGPFVPGAKGKNNVLTPGESYEGTCAVVVTSTGAKTSLTASDNTGVETGHLTQKLNEVPRNYTLAQPLFVGALDIGGQGGVAPIPGGPLSLPAVPLLNWTNPIIHDTVGVGFRQPIAETEALHTGKYAKTITLTLQQTEA